MFTNTKNIIYISKNNVEGAKVEISSTPQIKDRYKMPWTEGNLKDVLTSILEKLKTDRVRLLLAEDLTYVKTLFVPVQIRGDKERAFIFEKLQTLIPEELTDNDWDYKEIGHKSGEREIVAFAPVKSRFQIISKAFFEIGCLVEAVEPEVVAKSRNDEQIIGIALKKDIKGKDDQTLNIALAPADSTDTTEKTKARSSVKKGRLIVLILLTVLIIVIAATGYIFLAPSDHKSGEISVAVPTPVLVEKEEPPLPISTPTPELNLADYSVRVLNGSGIKGQAASVATALKEAGFKEVEIGNADAATYENTILEVKESSSSAALVEEVKNILDAYKIEEQDPLTLDSSFDLLITVGNKLNL